MTVDTDKKMIGNWLYFKNKEAIFGVDSIFDACKNIDNRQETFFLFSIRTMSSVKQQSFMR